MIQCIWFVWWAWAQASFLSGGGHYVRGGSQVLSDRLAALIVDTGGACESGRTVTGVLLDDAGRAAGVEHVATSPPAATADAAQELAPIVLGNASPHAIAGMLPADRRRAQFMAAYEGLQPSGSVAVVSLGSPGRRRSSAFDTSPRRSSRTGSNASLNCHRARGCWGQRPQSRRPITCSPTTPRSTLGFPGRASAWARSASTTASTTGRVSTGGDTRTGGCAGPITCWRHSIANSPASPAR